MAEDSGTQAEPERAQGSRPRDGAARSLGHIFISYRRSDTAGFAGRLHDALRDHFGHARVFRDIEAIEPGVDYVNAIDESIRACEVLVAVIGRRWLTCADENGCARLDDPSDFVRLELLSALDRDLTVIPVLVENVEMPTAKQLPEPLAALARHNALQITDDRWDYDVGRLIDRLEAVVGPPAESSKLSGRRARLRTWVRPRSAFGAAARILTALATLLTLIWGLQPFIHTTPAPTLMTGDFNIAIADFGTLDNQGRPLNSADAHALAQSIYDQLHIELQSIEKSGFDIQLRPPGQIGRLTGSTPAQRAATAAATAGRIRADVIVYGTLQTGAPGEFVPEFFVSENKLQGAEEFVGDYQLGSAIQLVGDISRNPVARKDLRDQLLGRTGSLAEFVVALGYSALEQWQPAFDNFRTAEAGVGWPERDGKEVLYLFLGNAAVKLGNLDSAKKFYDRALSINPEYSRARIGVAEVLLQRSRGTCEAGSADAGGLTKSLAMFETARSARVQPLLADIATKIAYGEGRAYLCLSQALAADHWADAERSLRQVVDAFDKGNPRVRTMAAESHAGIGFLSLPAAGDAYPVDRLHSAFDEYEKAIALFPQRDPEHRKAFFWSMLGFIYSRLGNTPKAQDAYAHAISLTDDAPAVRSRYESDLAHLTLQP